MKIATYTIPLLSLACGASLALAADGPGVDQVNAAVAKLKGTNFSWTSTLKIADSQFEIGPVKGASADDGTAHLTQDFNGNSTEVYLKGDKVAYKNQDGAWNLIGGAGGFETMFASSMSRNGATVSEVGYLLKDVGTLKVGDGGVITGDFTPDGAVDMMTFGPRRAAGAPAPAPAGGDDNGGPPGGFPPPKNCKGTVTFWIKDGNLVKYETHLTGSVNFGGNESEQDQTRTVEIHDVGSTKLDVPAEVKKLF